MKPTRAGFSDHLKMGGWGLWLGRPPTSPDLENQIRAAPDKPERTEGVRKIAARLASIREWFRGSAALSGAQA
jgi:hypothetical protein